MGSQTGHFHSIVPVPHVKREIRRGRSAPNEVLSQLQFCRAMSQRVVQEWVRTGQLRAAHYGTAWRISHADLEAFVAQASAPTPQAEAE
jgi:excisionase family DNA binding protein